MPRFIKVFTWLALAGVLLLTAALGHAFWQNNREVAPPQRGEVEAAFRRAVDWLHRNRQTVMNNHNTALWWMLKESADINPDASLQGFYQDYKKQVLDRRPPNIWTPYFRPGYRPYVPDIVEMQKLHPYQLFLVYGLSCDRDLGSEPVIQQQLDAGFCENHFLHPRCVTHQLMAVRLLQKRDCGEHEALARELLDIIETEITWDFRVTDSYLQRALMLVESRGKAALRPVWLRRILDAQLDDGGWADFHPLLSLASWQLGWTSTYPGTGPRAADFHATAQGIWLMALLLDEGDAN